MMPPTALSSKQLPLAVQVFSAAMEQQLPLNAYAAKLGVGVADLYQALTAKPGALPPGMLAALAAAYRQPPELLRDSPAVFSDESFGSWLKRNMEGISQLGLRTRANLEARELRSFLNESSLPNSDQAERLARALYITRNEVARAIVADLAGRARRGQVDVMALIVSEQPAPPPAKRPGSTRQRASAPNDAQPELLAEMPVEREPEAQVAPAEAPAPTAGAEEIAAPEVVRPARSKPRRQKVLAEAVASQQDHAEAGEVEPAAPDQPTTPARRRRQVSPPEEPAQNLDLAQQVSILEQLDPAPTEAPPAKRPARRAKASPPEQPPETERVPEPAPEFAPSEQSSAAAQPSEQVLHTASEHSANQAAPPELSAQQRSQRRAKKTPANDRPSPPVQAPEPAQPISSTLVDQVSAQAPAGLAPISAQITSSQTTIAISAEEARLLRRWRQLHPQGQRATLLYMASLLLEE